MLKKPGFRWNSENKYESFLLRLTRSSRKDYFGSLSNERTYPEPTGTNSPVVSWLVSTDQTGTPTYLFVYQNGKVGEGVSDGWDPGV